MSITKKWLAFCLAVCMIMPLVAGCGEIATKKEDGKLHIVTTVFPYYDFAKQIGGDRVSVDLIVPAGMDTHSFEPTAKDMVTIGEADVFIYNGGKLGAKGIRSGRRQKYNNAANDGSCQGC